MKYCQQCNKTYPNDKKFCVTCGGPLSNMEGEQAQNNQPAPFCRKCGNKLSPGMKFCIICGAPVEDDVTHILPNVSPAPAPTPKPAPMPQPIPRPQPAPVPQPAEKNSLKTVLLIIAIVLGSIILFAGAFFATEYFAFGQTPMDIYSIYILHEDVDEIEEDGEDIEEPVEDIEEPVEDGFPEAEEEGGDEVVAAAPAAEPEPTPTTTPMPTPEPTPTPWPAWNINANEIQRRIDDDVRATQNNRNHYKRIKAENGDVVLYTQSDVPVILDATAVMFDWNYDREYIGSGIYYVEVRSGNTVMERYYFEEQRLFRVVDMMGGYVHDYGEDGWEYYDEIGQRLKDERNRLMEYVQ